MANFEIALKPTLNNEGGYVNDDADSGKETYCGISRANFPAWTGWHKIDAWKQTNGVPHWNKVFTEAEMPGIAADVSEFYKVNFWDVIKGDQIINQNVASDLFDKAVNMGTHQAIILSQRSLEIAETGKMDENTLDTLNTKIPFA